jgi:hypothetical protein
MKNIIQTFRTGFVLVLICMMSYHLYAQSYGNEWINYSQSYYKFKIVNNGIYRIPVSSLYQLGMPQTVNGSQLQLFRDGQEVALFVSNDGNLTSNDYIEFYGERADGKLDVSLYKNPNHQLNPHMNLISDTAFYFLTYNNSNTNKRYTLHNNNIVSPPLKEAYFWDKVTLNYRGASAFAEGPSYFGANQSPVIYLTSSQFEDGEGYAKTFTTNNDSITVTCQSPYLVAGGPAGFLQTATVGRSYLTQHRVKIFANNNELADSTFTSFGYRKFNLAVPMSWINTSNNQFIFKYTPMNNGISNQPDRYGISYLHFRYPRQFNFGNSNNFYFELDPKVTDYYLEISNFNTGGVAPRLYDLTSEKYLIGDLSGNLVRFLIPASSVVKRLLLVSQATNVASTVSELSSVTFTNYTNAINQGDYIIITHPGLKDDGNGNDYTAEYRNYRSSAAGGSYQAIVADINDIYNQFGYGYTFSQLAIKNFLRFAHTSPQWSPKPKHVLIIGKGFAYNEYLRFTQSPFSTYPFYPVPSYGNPCSDILLTDFDKNSRPAISIGRLPAMSGSEIKTYLDKIKIHEQTVRNTNYNVSDSLLWRKRVLHLAGTNNVAEQLPIVSSLNSQENIIKGPHYGGQVTLLKKGSSNNIEDVNSKTIDDMFNTGIGLIQFFGHSSASTMDYNLDFPENYTNYGRFPTFIANGCGAGNMFILTAQKSLGERFVFAPNRGSISFIGSNNTGLTGSLSTYTDSLYRNFSQLMYGKSLGEQMQKTTFGLMSSPFLQNDNILRLHSEQIQLNGDPATSLFFFEKPDYAVEEKGINFAQLNLTSTIDSFDVSIVVHNLGKLSNDSVSVLIKRRLPNNIEEILISKYVPAFSNSDTLQLKIASYGDAGIGVNNLEIYLDQEAIIDELNEFNNSIVRQFIIYNDNLVPVYPYNYSIVSNQGITLKASTLNPFAPIKNYLMEIDTTEHFDSPLLTKTTISSSGGVIKWQPTITLRDSTVYYWRTAMDSAGTGNPLRWSYSSFIYLSQTQPGWNQSHYYQYQKNAYNNMYLDSASRKLTYLPLNKKLQVQNVCLYGGIL